MHRLIAALLILTQVALSNELDTFLSQAQSTLGDPGYQAARFLVDNMPDTDRETLTASFLLENLQLAFQARTEFAWAKNLPDEVFLNDVLPYAVFDETRDPWRKQLLELARPIVKQATSASEAAQALNQHLFNLIQVHYNTGRKRPNQSLKESQASGKATCTGLSIILVNACRSIGIPARAVGTPLWSNMRGNHTWVEIYDNGSWHFTGADEYDARGLNHGWFTGDAAQAQADNPRHAIYATSWKQNGLSFPMVWARRNNTVAAVNVTHHYASNTNPNTPETASLGVRLWDQPQGTRLTATIHLTDASLQTNLFGITKSGTADLNDMPRFTLPPKTTGTLRFTLNNETRELAFEPLQPGNPTLDAHWNQLKPSTTIPNHLTHWLQLPQEQQTHSPILSTHLTRSEATTATSLLYQHIASLQQSQHQEALNQHSLSLNEKTLRWTEKTFGNTPTNGHSLWISMHGGGNAPPAVNDRQWQNQGRLYTLSEGIYLAPRAPSDTWNLWHESHIDPLFQQLIDAYITTRQINPNRVYLLGYSAGGDGVWQLAPRMADRFAAAAMMAGHPNEASLLGLRNLPFALLVGGNDSAYKRNEIVTQRGHELDELAAQDPDGYPHFARTYEGLGHWMNGRDAEALPWMTQFSRNPWPHKIVWQQDDVVHHRFYWLQIPENTPIQERALIRAEINGQRITLSGDLPNTIQLRLSDELLDLDAPVLVVVNDTEIFQGYAPRQASATLQSLQQRLDPASACTALLTLHPNP
jgi:hypothetical protein